jgi:hypothetical protein
MAEAVVLFWRDIPAQVLVRTGRRSAKRELSKRFIEAIDRVAMREGATGSDAYLDQWRRGAPIACGDDLEAEAAALADRLEAEYDAARLQALADSGGRVS